MNEVCAVFLVTKVRKDRLEQIIAPFLGNDAKTAFSRIAHNDEQRNRLGNGRKLRRRIHDELFECSFPTFHEVFRQPQCPGRIIPKPLKALHQRHITRSQYIERFLDISRINVISVKSHITFPGFLSEVK